MNIARMNIALIQVIVQVRIQAIQVIAVVLLMLVIVLVRIQITLAVVLIIVRVWVDRTVVRWLMVVAWVTAAQRLMNVDVDRTAWHVDRLV